MTRFTTFLLLALIFSSCSENKIIYVAPALQNCETQGDKKCLMIKENKEDDWQLFDGEIEGFDYKEGSMYKIEVKISKAKGATNEKDQLKYELLKVIYQESSKQVLLPSPTLEGQWVVQRISGLDSLQKQPTIRIKDGQISGNAGCNNYSASCEIDGNSIVIGLTMATKMYCTNMKVEKAFFDGLKKADNFKLEDEQLLVFDQDGRELFAALLAK